MNKFFEITQTENILSKTKKIGIDNFIPSGSFILNCMDKNKIEVDLIAHYTPKNKENEK